MSKVQKPFLSFCIPTYDRLEILRNTIESIYADLDGVDLDEFEVIVSDNQPDQSAKKVIEKFLFKNLFYFSTDCSGFLNSFNVLKCGNGQFLKLHNNYTKLRKGTLKKMIAEIKENISAKGLIFYTDGLNQNGEIKKINSFNSFMYELSYFSSWSTGFGIWRDDFLKVVESIKIDKYFPQTSLLLSQSKKNEYIINDRPIFDNQKIPKKGGYNIFKVFSVDFISLIEKCYLSGEINKDTLRKIKFNLLYNYLSVRYFKTVIVRVDDFEKSDIKKSITTYYSNIEYYAMIMTAFISPFKFVIRKIKIALFKQLK